MRKRKGKEKEISPLFPSLPHLYLIFKVEFISIIFRSLAFTSLLIFSPGQTGSAL
jgi:hypothetical protein